MNKDENLKVAVIERCVKGKMTVQEAARRLELSERQVKYLKARYKKYGVSSMQHGNCGRQPSHTLAPSIKEKILEIKRKPCYEKVNFTQFCEDLKGEYGIEISYTALRNLLIKNGYTSPKTQRKRKVQHPRRERKRQFGEMLQTDATPYPWFGGKETYALHALIDDATGKLTGLYICKNECAEGYFQVLGQTIESHGVPASIYADGLSLFFSNKKPSIEEQLEGKHSGSTQFGEIAKQLGIQLIHARSPQAKGRVERLWETLQSRLPVEFAKLGIDTVEAANDYLREEYVRVFNTRFGVEATNNITAFMPRPKGIILNQLLSIKYTRIVDNSGCFSLNNVIFQCNVPHIPLKSKIEVLINARLGVKVLYNGHLFTPTPFQDKKKSQALGSSIDSIIAKFIYENCLKNEHVA